ncbi:MAG: tetratricopeptide repeat protein [Myxococcales bacterium]|nr:tetratricopeptide repeat protein [Myxococcales bacterium]MCB9751674.1 tetratricopeptide repeat protein [Myxococcales bacterium]
MGTSAGCSGDPQVDPAEQAEKVKSNLKSARVHIADGKIEKARLMLKTVLEIDPNNADAAYCMGRVAFADGANDKAITLIEKASTTEPENHEYLFWLGEVYKADENFNAAATAYGKAFALDPENGDYGLAHAKMLKKAGKFGDAEPILQKVIEIDEQVEYVYTELGDVLRETGKDDEALRTYMKAQTVHPGDLMAHAGAALVYEKKGDIKHALDEWSTYVRMDCCSDYSKTVARKKIQELGGDAGGGDEGGDADS